MAPGTYESLRNRIAEDLAINRLRQQQVMSHQNQRPRCREFPEISTRSGGTG